MLFGWCACASDDRLRKRHECSNLGNQIRRLEEHLEEHRNPKRGATVGKANYRTGGTRLHAEQSLEVEERSERQPACG